MNAPARVLDTIAWRILGVKYKLWSTSYIALHKKEYLESDIVFSGVFQKQFKVEQGHDTYHMDTLM
jgi:hypothetical protein